MDLSYNPRINGTITDNMVRAMPNLAFLSILGMLTD